MSEKNRILTVEEVTSSISKKADDLVSKAVEGGMSEEKAWELMAMALSGLLVSNPNKD